MIDGLALDFAGTRAAARLAWRPDDRLWQRLHAARDLRALLDGARNAAVGNYLANVAAHAGSDAIDAAFRAQLRSRVAELAGWSPADWRPALLWCAHLVDVPAVAHLWSQPALPWMAADPVLARYAGTAPNDGARRALLLGGPLAPIGRALLTQAAPAEPSHAKPRAPADPAPLPRALQAWLDHWQSLWPRLDGDAREALAALRDEVLAHRRRFAQLPVADTQAARDAFAARVLARLRADPAQPVALFAYLVVLALDLERLRAECLRHAFDAAASVTSLTSLASMTSMPSATAATGSATGAAP